MAFIELVDYNETYVTDRPKKKKTRRRGGTKKSTTSAVVESSENLEVVEKDSSEVEDTVDNVEITTEKDKEPKEEKRLKTKLKWNQQKKLMKKKMK